jgi:hypothetical protein
MCIYLTQMFIQIGQKCGKGGYKALHVTKLSKDFTASIFRTLTMNLHIIVKSTCAKFYRNRKKQEQYFIYSLKEVWLPSTEFHDTCSTQRHYVEIFCTELHQSRSRNVDGKGRKPFTPVSKVLCR